MTEPGDMQPDQFRDRARYYWRSAVLGLGVLLLVGGLMWFITASQRYAAETSVERHLWMNEEEALDSLYSSAVPVAVGSALIAVAVFRAKGRGGR